MFVLAPWQNPILKSGLNSVGTGTWKEKKFCLGSYYYFFVFLQGWKRQADRLAAKYTQKMSKAPAQKTKSTYTPHGRVGRPPLNKQTVEAVIETKPSPPAAPR